MRARRWDLDGLNGGITTPSEEDEQKERRWTRRDWVKASALAGASGVAGAAIGAEMIAPLLRPPEQLSGVVLDDLVYTKFPTAQWWDNQVGEPVHVDDLQVWQGADAVWRGLFRDGTYVVGTGFPVLVIRIIRDDTYFHPPDPAPYPIPSGYSLFYDDPARDLRIVVLFDRCTHLCCYPAWHLAGDLPPGPPRDYGTYGAAPPTWTVYGEDPVWCLCHDAQFDPLLLTADVNPINGVPFVGARIVHGPGKFSLPVVPVRAVNDVLYGGMPDPRWYAYC